MNAHQPIQTAGTLVAANNQREKENLLVSCPRNSRYVCFFGDRTLA